MYLYDTMICQKLMDKPSNVLVRCYCGVLTNLKNTLLVIYGTLQFGDGVKLAGNTYDER